MNVLQLVLLALETIAKVATNPSLGLGNDGTRVASLVALVAKLGRQGDAAASELRSFTDEVEAIAESGDAVDAATWDALTERRHSQAEAIAALDP